MELAVLLGTVLRHFRIVSSDSSEKLVAKAKLLLSPDTTQASSQFILRM
jgi:hypothetical protein